MECSLRSMTPIPNSTSGSRSQPADVQMLERFSRAAVGLRAALLPRVPTRFMLKYTLRAAHLKIGGVDLDLAVEDDVLPLGLTWLSRSGSNGKSGTVLSETNGHYYRHLGHDLPVSKPIGKQADQTDGASGGCHQGRPGRNPAPRTSARSNGTTSFSTASTSSIVPGSAKERVLMLYFNTNVGATLVSSRG